MHHRTKFSNVLASQENNQFQISCHPINSALQLKIPYYTTKPVLLFNSSKYQVVSAQLVSLAIAAMNESELQENDRDDQSIHDRNQFLGFDYKSYVDSLSLCDALKCCLLKFVVNGADKVFMDQKFSERSSFGSDIGQHI
jgi:hypothetical protein